MTGGVTSFRSTNSHKLCAKAGRRYHLDMPAASKASKLATTALLTAISRIVDIIRFALSVQAVRSITERFPEAFLSF
jgi:hypothetical protein